MVALLLGVWSMMIGVGGCEKEEKEPEVKLGQVKIITTIPHEYGEIPFYEDADTVLANAKVTFYRSFQDYMLRENAFFEDYTDENGQVNTELPVNDTIWIAASLQHLNEFRYARYHLNNIFSCVVPYEIYFVVGENYIRGIGLTPPPAQLQLNVMHAGEPVDGANVTLYFSKEAYDLDLPATRDWEQLLASHGSFRPEQEDQSTASCLKHTFVNKTDASGNVLFDNLEPRQYWFRVEKNGMTNSAGTITTDKELSTNIDLITTLTVGIN